MSEWSECSRTCNVGSQTRNVTCLERAVEISLKYEAVAESFSPAEDVMCAMSAEAGERPADRQLCNTQDCPFWQTSMFGEVRSLHCGFLTW